MTMPPSAAPITQEEDSEPTIVVKMDLPIAQEVHRKRLGSEMSPEPAATIPQATATPSKKRTKLSDAEKLAKEQERERERLKKELEKKDKEQEKEQERLKREEEREQKRIVKEERQRVKDEAKRKKDDEQRKKDEERRKKDEEKAKKERSQLRLNNFFKMPTAPKESTPPTQPSRTSPAPEANPTLSVSDYDKIFHPFFVKQNVTLAPLPFQKDDVYKTTISQALDAALAQASPVYSTEEAAVRGVTKEDIAELLHIPPHKASRRGNLLTYSTKDVLARINAPELPPLTANGEGPYDSPYYLKLLNLLPNKFLKFAEDVRPPYNGTYTRNPSSSGLRKGRKPFERSLPGVNYDYDSEAEWVADEEGEDLLSEEEDDRDSAGEDDDLDGFLDDEEDTGPKRGGVGVLIPLNSGMCWEDEHGKNSKPDLDEMRMGVLINGLSGPIDPFSTSYWQPKSAPKQNQNRAMDPPRLPLMLASQNLGIPSATEAGKPSLPLKKFVPPKEIDAFRNAINGSDMTKAGLIEVLKKQFPKITKEALKNSLELHAERIGDRQDDKRWILK